MHRFKTLAMFAAMLLSTALSFGQKRSNTDLRYAFGSTIDLHSGFSTMPYSVTGDAGKGYGATSGGNFMMRYSYFFGKHVGVFGSYSFDGGDAEMNDYFRAVNNADGDRYKYDITSSRYAMNHCLNSFFAGVVFRYDFYKFSLRPRMGVGVSNFDMYSFSYDRYNRKEGSLATNYNYSIISSRPDYIMSDNGEPDLNCLSGFAGLQLTYSVASHFFFSIECSVKCIYNRKLGYRRTEMQYKPAYEPENWSQALIEYNLKGSYVTDSDTAQSISASLPFAVINANIGIGWNIGWNRNVSRHNHR